MRASTADFGEWKSLTNSEREEESMIDWGKGIIGMLRKEKSVIC